MFSCVFVYCFWAFCVCFVSSVRRLSVILCVLRVFLYLFASSQMSGSANAASASIEKGKKEKSLAQRTSVTGSNTRRSSAGLLQMSAAALFLAIWKKRSAAALFLTVCKKSPPPRRRCPIPRTHVPASIKKGKKEKSLAQRTLSRRLFRPSRSRAQTPFDLRDLQTHTDKHRATSFRRHY